MLSRLTLIGFAIVLTLAGCVRKAPVSNGGAAQVALTPEEKLVELAIRLTPSNDTSGAANDNIKTFHPRDTVHAIVTSKNASDGMLLTGRWYFLPSTIKLAENRTTLQNGTNITHFDLLRSEPWVPGQYKLIVYLDSAAKDSAVFSVVK